MRVTNHCGRYNRNGVFSAKHNDRDFDVSKAEHIDVTKQNIEWNIYEEKLGFEAVEKKFYEEHFSEYLEIQNLKYEVSRNYAKKKTMEQYRKSKQTCPEEVILQIGNKDDTIDEKKAVSLFEEYIAWLRKSFPNCVIVDYAIHLDETTPHCHLRRVWIGHDDKYKREIVSQNKALIEMGIGLETEHTRFDNPKKIFTNMCREYFEKLCEDHGIELDHERLPEGKQGKELIDFKIAKEQERLDVLKHKYVEEKAKLVELEQKVQVANNEIAMSEEKIAAARLNLEELKLQVEKERKEFEADKEEAKQAIQAAYDDLKNAARFFDNRGLQIVGKEELEAIKLRAANAQLKKENDKLRKMLGLETRQQEQLRRQQAVRKFTR